MKQYIAILVALLSVLLVSAQDTPVDPPYSTPTSGKYFYGHLNHDRAVSYVSIGVGSQEQPLNFLFNTEELTLAMFTVNCSSPLFGHPCIVPEPYDPVPDRDRTGLVHNQSYEDGFLYQNGSITQITLQGEEIITDFNVTLPNFLRSFDYTGYAFAIYQLVGNPYYSNLVSGFIGIAPYTWISQGTGGQRVQYGENFLYQLRQQGNIDHQVISFYVNDDDDKESFVKIGGYDAAGFQNPDQMMILNTTGKFAWDIQSKEINFHGDGGTFQSKTSGLKVIMEPAFPFFYVPPTVLDSFKNTAASKSVFQDVEYLDNAIRFTKPCDQVNLIVPAHLTITFTDDAVVDFDIRELLVPSEHVDESITGMCYIGIFHNTNAKEPEMFYLGQLYMRKYYTFFDISGVQENNTETLTVGTGRKNLDATILESNYNKSSPNFKFESGDQSSWTYEPNEFTIEKEENPIQQFIRKNTVLFILCCVILAFLIVTLCCLCIYLKRKSNKNRMGNIFKDKMTYYGKQNTKGNRTIQGGAMDLSLSLDQDDSGHLKNVDTQRNNLV